MIRARIFAACFACALLFTSAALAEPETPSSRETSFQAVSGSTEEGVPGGSLMVGAYALLWLFVGLYLVRLGRAQAGTDAQLAALERRLAQAGKPGA